MIFSFISAILGPATKLIDEVVTSDEERLTLRNELAKIEKDVKIKALDLEAEVLKSRASIIKSESESQSWITRSWRPLSSISLVAYVVFSPFFNHQVPPEIYQILTIFLSVYGGGRSIEMAAKHISNIKK